MKIYPTMSVNAINVNELTSPLERHRLSDWMHRNNRKQNPSLCLFEDAHLEQKCYITNKETAEKKRKDGNL